MKKWRLKQILMGIGCIALGCVTIPILDGDATGALFMWLTGIGCIINPYRMIV